MSIITTSQLLPTNIVQNGVGVNTWVNPNNILLADSKFADTFDSTSVLTVGGFNPSLLATYSPVNINLQVKGYRGSFNTTLQIFAIDDSTGVEYAYPIVPSFQGFNGTNTLYTIPSTLFGTTWDYNQANNIKIRLIADGELHIDYVSLSVSYDDGVTGTPLPTTYGQTVVDEYVQIQPLILAQSFTTNDTYLWLRSFKLVSGDEVTYTNDGAPFYGEACFVINQGQDNEENIIISKVEQNYNGTGLVRCTVSSRGVNFVYPYTSDVTLKNDHDANSEIVASNNARYYNRFLKTAQIGALVAPPLATFDESISLASSTKKYNFKGAGVTASVSATSITGADIDVIVPGFGVNPPTVVETSSATSGSTQVSTLTWQHTSSGVNRLLVVNSSTPIAANISAITYNGIALTQDVIATSTSQWTLTAPPIGTYPIVITLSTPDYISAGAETFVGVDQTTPIGATQTSTGTSLNPSLILNTTVDNSIVVDSVSTGVTPIVYTVGAGQTLNWSHTLNTDTRQGASSLELAGSTPDAVTMSYAITQNTLWSMTALEVIGIGLGSPVTGVLAVKEEGVVVDSNVVSMNFVGTGVTATQTSAGNVDVTITAGGSGTAVEESVTQAAHGFIVGDVVGSNDTANQYKKVISLNTDNMPIGIVVAPVATNTFKLVTSGFATITPSLLTTFANGDIIWHSTTVAGGITVNKPTSGVVRKLGVVIDKAAGKVYVDIDSGFENGSTTNILGLQNGELFVGKNIVPLGFYKTTNYNFVEVLSNSYNSNNLELSLSILYKPVLQKFDLTGFLVSTLATPDTLLVPTSPTDFEWRYTTDGTFIYALSVYSNGGLRYADIAKYDLSFNLINIVNLYSNSNMSIATNAGGSPAFRGSAFNITNGFIYMNLSFATNVSTFQKRNIDASYSIVNSSTATTTSFTQIYGNGANIYLLRSGSTSTAEIDKWNISGATATSLGPISNTVFKINYNNNPVSGYNNIMGNLYQNGSDVSIPVFKVTIDHYRSGSSTDFVAWFIETVEDKIIYTL